MEQFPIFVPLAGAILLQALVSACCCIRLQRRLRTHDTTHSHLLERIHRLENPPPAQHAFVGGTSFGYTAAPPVSYYTQGARYPIMPAAPPAPPAHPPAPSAPLPRSV